MAQPATPTIQGVLPPKEDSTTPLAGGAARPLAGAANNAPLDSLAEAQKLLLESHRAFLEIQMQQVEKLNQLTLKSAEMNMDLLRMFHAATADVVAKGVHAKPEVINEILNGIHNFCKEKGFTP